MMSSDHQRCHNATFVDLDYPELIYRKCAMIKESRPILDLLHNTSFSNDSNDTVLLRSGHYIAAGCDLNAPDQLLKLVKDTFDAKDCLFLLVAEVSICYMETKQANNVIRVGASLGQGTHTCKYVGVVIEMLIRKSSILSFRAISPSRIKLSFCEDYACPFQKGQGHFEVNRRVSIFT